MMWWVWMLICAGGVSGGTAAPAGDAGTLFYTIPLITKDS
jgi:hypothetical protein